MPVRHTGAYRHKKHCAFLRLSPTPPYSELVKGSNFEALVKLQLSVNRLAN